MKTDRCLYLALLRVTYSPSILRCSPPLSLLDPKSYNKGRPLRLAPRLFLWEMEFHIAHIVSFFPVSSRPLRIFWGPCFCTPSLISLQSLKWHCRCREALDCLVPEWDFFAGELGLPVCLIIIVSKWTWLSATHYELGWELLNKGTLVPFSISSEDECFLKREGSFTGKHLRQLKASCSQRIMVLVNTEEKLASGQDSVQVVWKCLCEKEVRGQNAGERIIRKITSVAHSQGWQEGIFRDTVLSANSCQNNCLHVESEFTKMGTV